MLISTVPRQDDFGEEVLFVNEIDLMPYKRPNETTQSPCNHDETPTSLSIAIVIDKA